jgi:hypothetical protein
MGSSTFIIIIIIIIIGHKSKGRRVVHLVLIMYEPNMELSNTTLNEYLNWYLPLQKRQHTIEELGTRTNLNLISIRFKV